MNFIQRNKSIFIFGLVIGALFVIIIAIAWEQDRVSEVILTPFTSREADREIEDYTYEAPPTPTPITISDEPKLSADGVTEVSKGTVVDSTLEPPKVKMRPDEIIAFTDEGFSPMTGAVHIPQVVEWVNDTEEQITIKELLNPQSDDTPVIINPGDSFKLIVKETGYWTFKELGSGKAARYYVAKN